MPRGVTWVGGAQVSGVRNLERHHTELRGGGLCFLYSDPTLNSLGNFEGRSKCNLGC